MKLTGKSLEQFEKWYCENVYKKECELYHYALVVYDQFYIHSESMQYGVLVDFFDSVGIYIHIVMEEYGFDMDKTIHKCSITINFEHFEGELTRPQARTKAIEKANEIYNNR